MQLSNSNAQGPKTQSGNKNRNTFIATDYTEVFVKLAPGGTNSLLVLLLISFIHSSDFIFGTHDYKELFITMTNYL